MDNILNCIFLRENLECQPSPIFSEKVASKVVVVVVFLNAADDRLNCELFTIIIINIMHYKHVPRSQQISIHS